MSTKTTGSKPSYIRHSAEYKQESLKSAALVGVAKAAKQLGLHESQLYAWRKQSEHTQDVSEREVNLATENARLKRHVAQQAEELSILLVPCGYKIRRRTSLNNSNEVRIYETASS
jgi:transposase